MLRILALSAILFLPAIGFAQSSAPEAGCLQTGDDVAPLAATKRAFTAVRNELRTIDRRGTNSGQYALILDHAAARLDNLPILGVDAQLLDFGFGMATRLRNVAQMYRDVGLRASIFDQNFTECVEEEAGDFWVYYIRYWCRTYRDHTERQVALLDAVRFRSEQTNEIRSSFAMVRRDLTARYGAEFN
jgi:hypothetical protein